jgi:hypothetical protein
VRHSYFIARLAVVLLAPAVVSAQRNVTIDSGMTRSQVVAALGEPLSARAYQNFTYLLYRNGCEKTCGMNDLVVLDGGTVVDAVFRSTTRHYSGTSSSPRMIPVADAKRDAKHIPARPLSVPVTPPKKPIT